MTCSPCAARAALARTRRCTTVLINCARKCSRHSSEASASAEAAADQLLAILEKNMTWKDGAAKEQLLKIFEAAGPKADVTKEGRRRLASLGSLRLQPRGGLATFHAHAQNLMGRRLRKRPAERARGAADERL